MTPVELITLAVVLVVVSIFCIGSLLVMACYKDGKIVLDEHDIDSLESVKETNDS